MRIGLTGGIAAGKSSVSEILASLGAWILDADAISREMVEPGSAGLEGIVREFGEKILKADGTLDRAALGAEVFSDDARRGRLNGILHPIIKSEMLNRAGRIESEYPDAIVIMDVPLLIESGWQDMADEVWLVTAPLEERIRRIALRDGLDRRQAERRIAAQMPDGEKAKYVDIIINNGGNMDELKAIVSDLYAERKYGKKEKKTQEQ